MQITTNGETADFPAFPFVRLSSEMNVMEKALSKVFQSHLCLMLAVE